MSATITKPAINIRSTLIENNQQYGLAGKQLLESNTLLDARVLLSADSKNLIINGNFDVWQRGVVLSSSLNQSFYGPDRWQSNTSGYSSITHKWDRQPFVGGLSSTLNNLSYYARFSIESFTGTGTATIIEQRIENKHIKSNIVTTSFYMKSNVPLTITPDLVQAWDNIDSNILYSQADIDITNTWNKYTFITEIDIDTDNVLGDNSYLRLRFTLPNNVLCELDVAQVQLETGQNVTDFEYRSRSEELRLCQRYYQKSYDVDTSPGTITTNGQIRELANRNEVDSTPGCRFNTKMRTAPSVQLYSPVTGSIGQINNSSDLPGTAQDIGDSGFGPVTYSGGTLTSDALYHYTADAEI